MNIFKKFLLPILSVLLSALSTNALCMQSDWKTSIFAKQNKFTETYRDLLQKNYFETADPSALMPAGFEKNIQNANAALMALNEWLVKKNDAQAWTLINQISKLYYPELVKMISEFETNEQEKLTLLETSQRLSKFKTQAAFGKYSPFKPVLTKLVLTIFAIQQNNKMTEAQAKACLSLSILQIKQELLTLTKEISDPSLDEVQIKKFIDLVLVKSTSTKIKIRSEEKKLLIKAIIITTCILVCIAAVSGVVWFGGKRIKKAITTASSQAAEASTVAGEILSYKLGTAERQTEIGVNQTIINLVGSLGTLPADATRDIITQLLALRIRAQPIITIAPAAPDAPAHMAAPAAHPELDHHQLMLNALGVIQRLRDEQVTADQRFIAARGHWTKSQNPLVQSILRGLAPAADAPAAD